MSVRGRKKEQKRGDVGGKGRVGDKTMEDEERGRKGKSEEGVKKMM